MLLKKIALSIVLFTLPIFAAAATGFTAINQSDKTVSFIVNGQPCAASNSCVIESKASITLTEKQLADLCGENQDMCAISFVMAERNSSIGGAVYVVNDKISYTWTARWFNYGVEQVDGHTIKVYQKS